MKTPEVLSAWVHQEGDRFKDLLKERGFLRAEDDEHPDVVLAASRVWRETYLQGIHPELREWSERDVPTADIPTWRLGGWSGCGNHIEGRTHCSQHSATSWPR